MQAPRITLVTVAAVLGLAASTVHAQTPNPLVGTWEADMSKSTFTPGPGPKSITLHVTQTDQGLKSVSDSVMGDGSKRHVEFTTKEDGKDSPIVGLPIADTVSVTRKGNTRTRVDKKDGKVVMTYDGTISADGKTFTVRQKGTDPQGQPITGTIVFSKKS